jgi:hypothetical protein
MPNEADARVWLRANGFSKIADAIDGIMESWRERGLKTRRNWWEALAGTPKGSPMTVEGVVFPMIAAVRHRRGLEPADGAIELRRGVTVPEEVQQARWATVKGPKKRKRVASKKRQ